MVAGSHFAHDGCDKHSGIKFDGATAAAEDDVASVATGASATGDDAVLAAHALRLSTLENALCLEAEELRESLGSRGTRYFVNDVIERMCDEVHDNRRTPTAAAAAVVRLKLAARHANRVPTAGGAHSSGTRKRASSDSDSDSSSSSSSSSARKKRKKKKSRPSQPAAKKSRSTSSKSKPLCFKWADHQVGREDKSCSKECRESDRFCHKFLDGEKKKVREDGARKAMGY